MRTLHRLLLAVVGAGATGCEPLSPGEVGNLVPRTVAEDATLPAIEMNGSRFHVETRGNPANPVIVILHGGPGGDYRSLLRLADRHDGVSLADDYYLVFWDQRGSGLSKRHGERELTIANYVADLDSIMNRYSPGRPAYLIGESWGGMFATRYIDGNPQRVAGAVLIEPGPLDGATFERIEDDLNPTELGAEWLNDVVWSGQFLSPDDHERLDFQRLLGIRNSQPGNHTDNVNPAAAWRMGAAANRYIMEDGQDGHGTFTFDFTRNLSRYTTPVLFIAGSRSEVLGESLQRQQVAKYPSASLAVVQGAGHDVAWVKAGEVTSLIRGYLAARRGGVR